MDIRVRNSTTPNRISRGMVLITASEFWAFLIADASRIQAPPDSFVKLITGPKKRKPQAARLNKSQMV
jgi:peptidyl-tRNA hydrolase